MTAKGRSSNVIEFRRLEAIASRTLLQAKSTNWQQYLSTANRYTDSKQVWQVIRNKIFMWWI